MKTKFTNIINQLRRDAEMGSRNSAAAADAIDALVFELVSARATFSLMERDDEDMNRIGAGVTRAKIDRFLELETN